MTDGKVPLAKRSENAVGTHRFHTHQQAFLPCTRYVESGKAGSIVALDASAFASFTEGADLTMCVSLQSVDIP